jgi:hypothetical protein
MPTFVYLDNYRGFSSQLVPLKRVNFLVGENSTGKSSFLELLQTFSHPGFWLLEPRFGAPGAHQRHFLDLVSAHAKEKKSFTIGALAMSSDSAEKDRGMLVTYINSDGRPVPNRVTIVKGGRLRTLDGRLWISNKGEIYRARMELARSENEWSLQDRARSFTDLHRSDSGEFEERVISEEMQASPLFFRAQDFLFDDEEFESRPTEVPFPFGGEVVSLAPIRTKTRRTYDAPQTEFSPEGEHTPYLIKKRLASASQAESFRKFLERAGRESGLFQSIRVKSYGTNQLAPFELQVVLGRTALGLDNVGYGVSQALPVIVEMFTRPRRTLMNIQQPEVHLHPKAQATFGDLVAELAREEEKRFLIETHSDFAIDRYRLNIRRNGGVPSQLLFFSRGENGNTAAAIEIQDDGSLPEDQPKEYRDFFFNESLALLS